MDVQERQAPKTKTHLTQSVQEFTDLKTLLAQQEMYISKISECVEQNLDRDIVPVLERANQALEAKAQFLQDNFNMILQKATEETQDSLN